MATATRSQALVPAPTLGGTRSYKFNVRQYMKIIDAGVFPADARLELLGGVIVEKRIKYPPHNFTVFTLGEFLRDLVKPVAIVREEKTVVLGPYWCPEPDIAIVIGPPRRYVQAHPHPKDIFFLVEVSESTYDEDRRQKWSGYSAAKVLQYWIVNLGQRVVEVYTHPIGRGKTARYRDATIYGEGDSVPVVIEGRELGTIAVVEILP